MMKHTSTGCKPSSGGLVASSGMPFANTAAIISSSYINSVGTAVYTGGMTDVAVSFGAGSYNITEGSFRGIWDWKDLNKMEKIGYSLGTFVNLKDFGKAGDLNYNVEKKHLINHAAITDENNNSILSFGPGKSPKYNYFTDGKTGLLLNSKHYTKMLGGIKGTNEYVIHGRDIPLKGVNTSIIKGYGKMLTYLSKKGLAPYSFAYSSCSTHAGLAMWLSGVPNLFIHPYTLQASVWLWNQGVTPALIRNSYHLINNN